MKLFKAVGVGITLFLITLGYARADDYWLMIDTRAQSLMVMKGERVQLSFDNIAIGRNGPAPLRTRGDNTTPLGTFHIAWVNPRSKFKTFFGFDYPSRPLAEAALRQGLIDIFTYEDIVSAIDAGRVPPQNTPLGGFLGIHGLGNADPGIHEKLNWTQGCVALTNEQIEELAKWVDIGTRVVISEGHMAAVDKHDRQIH